MERNLKTRGIQNMVTIQQHQDQGPGNANQANNSSKISTIITKPCGVWHIVAIFDYYYLQLLVNRLTYGSLNLKNTLKVDNIQTLNQNKSFLLNNLEYVFR